MYLIKRRFSTQVFRPVLETKKVKELKSLATQVGILSGGVKAELIDRLDSHLSNIQERNGSKSILSIDLGYRNLAYCQLTKDGVILDWARIDLELPSFHPSVIAPIVRKFLADKIVPNLKTVDTILIEQQRARTNGAHSIIEHTVRVNCVEAILWCGLYEIKDTISNQILLTPILRQNIDKFWQSELDQIATEFAIVKKGTYQKKLATTKLVQKWLDTNTKVDCSHDLKLMFNTEKKKDDLSDCLLQALTWYEWEANSKNFILNNKN